MARIQEDPTLEKNLDLTFIERFCDILVKNKALKNHDGKELEKLFKESSALYFEDFLLEEDMVTKEDLLQALGEYYEMPAIDVIGIFFDHHLVRMFPKDVMLRNGFIPYEREDDTDILVVIAARPRHPALPEIIGNFVSYDVTFMAGIYNDICDQAEEFYDQSIETAEIEMFEDTTDKHEEDERLQDIVNNIDEE